MPYQTALAVTGVITRPDLWITFSVNDPDMLDGNVKQQVAMLMRRLHRLKPDQPDDFVVEASDMHRKDVQADLDDDHAGGRGHRRASRCSSAASAS